mmetsp:Transcript_37777/g.65882  ORF Transcript_37777/g.65882 Transcript_37777/m.65882 type:complete len:116 (+) Transcript_37777:2-349(+)
MPKYLSELASRNCSDVAVDSTILLNYAQGLKGYIHSVGDERERKKQDAELMLETLRSEGCGIVTKMDKEKMNFPWGDMCLLDVGWSLMPFTFACPETCACKAHSKLPFCPAACFS